jgi:hypothetical protein
MSSLSVSDISPEEKSFARGEQSVQKTIDSFLLPTDDPNELIIKIRDEAYSKLDANKLKGDLLEIWESQKLDKFEHAEKFSLSYCCFITDFPNSQEIFDLVFIFCVHLFALDAYIQSNLELNTNDILKSDINKKYLNIIKEKTSDKIYNYYIIILDKWVLSVVDEQRLLSSDSSPNEGELFQWINWRSVNVAAGSIIELIILMFDISLLKNTRNEENNYMQHVELFSLIQYISLTCGMMNDIASIEKDKRELEYNIFNKLLEKEKIWTIEERKTNIFELAKKCLEKLNNSEINSPKIKSILLSVILGNLDIYTSNSRYYNQDSMKW